MSAPYAPESIQVVDELTRMVHAKADADIQASLHPAAQAVNTELPQVLAGRYRIERLLRAGGMGAVYLARDLLQEQLGDPDPYVAIKVMGDEFAAAPDASVLLYSEFALTRHLHHPHVVRLFNFEMDATSGRAFIVLELLRGLTLDQLLCERAQGLPWLELQDIAVDLLGALSHAHRCGVLHGDIKPSNVMLADDGLRLFDFGLGQATAGALTRLPRLSRERINAWTPGYAAPEILDGGPLSACADVYAMACVLFELASGKHPYQRLDAVQARKQRLDSALQRPRQLPQHCWPALRRALSFDPRARRTDARKLQETFRTAPRAPNWRWF
jgi:serine/threonine-protein kinase Stk1